MTENITIAVSDILEGLAQQAGLPALSVNGQRVEAADIAAALRQAADREKHSPASGGVSVGSIFRWLLYSVVVTLFLTVIFKMVGMASGSHLSREDLIHELVLRGDLLLISAGFAAEAIGDLFAATAARSTPRWTVGFMCLIGLMSSMLLVTCCAVLPNDLHTVSSVIQSPQTLSVDRLQAIGTLETIIVWASPPVFFVTMLGVLISKFIVGEP